MELNQFTSKSEHGSFVNGAFRLDKPLKRQSLKSPVTKKPWKSLALATPKLVQEAILKAHEAFLVWKWTPSPTRAHFLRQIYYKLLHHQELFAHTMAMEMGKPLIEGIREVEYAANYFLWFAGEAERLYGKTIPASQFNKRLSVIPIPLGVCGIITPWNFPLAMGARKIAAALAAGCTVVVKPSNECPITMSLFAFICNEIQLPNGVFNLVIGQETMIGKELFHSPLVKKISFTGSTQVGKLIFRESADTLKKLTLELGGHAPLLVFDDADIDVAVQGTIAAKLRNNGQTCVAANRILVQKNIYKDFTKALVKAVKALKVGSPLERDTDLSTVLHPSAEKKVKLHIQDAIKKGATVLLEGKEPYSPTILDKVTPKMKLFHEETFGPVLPICSFNTYEEGIALANHSQYGLAAYLFSNNLNQTHRAVEELQYGIIGVNDGSPSCAQASFGGIKESGFGREGGPSGIHEYITEKFISVAFNK